LTIIDCTTDIIDCTTDIYLLYNFKVNKCTSSNMMLENDVIWLFYVFVILDFQCSVREMEAQEPRRAFSFITLPIQSPHW